MPASTYFVLNGFVNGEESAGRAIPAGGGGDRVQADGWYVLREGATDGRGPHKSREAAEAEAATTYWAFPLDGSPPDEILGDEGDFFGDGEHNVAAMRVVRSGVYRFDLEGSYETLTMEISAPTAFDAARVYALALEASSNFQ